MQEMKNKRKILEYKDSILRLSLAGMIRKWQVGGWKMFRKI